MASFLIALAGLLAAIIIKAGDHYFNRLRLAGEKNALPNRLRGINKPSLPMVQ